MMHNLAMMRNLAMTRQRPLAIRAPESPSGQRLWQNTAGARFPRMMLGPTIQ
jgi:hypothetical protein